ncbi:hypothetical protein [Tuanshanicoccus lijuaniae]|uniref:hypothetical protein n=1 Tax=Aerococcaceae bacterium zg-1292 TaxID=2774330 RepID=UPI001BD8E5E6|nr:hypothetical protein [Aerococcaceae bacterium zg-A91]MBS4458069.1 hypothetical protein [Aerococcaceae bacterium zg-BR33]
MLTSSIMALSLATGINPSLTFQEIQGVVYAQEMTPELQELKSWLISSTPLTEEMWNNLPLSEWERYRVGYIDVPNPDKFFDAAVTQHPAAFKPFIDNIKQELITKHNVPQEKLNLVDDVKLFNAYFSYQIHSDFSSIEDALGLDTTSESNASSQVEDLTPPTLPDRAGAEERVKNTGLDKMIPDFLKITGISDEIISKIPTETFFEGAVTYYMTHITGGDYGTISYFFMQTFPEYFKEVTNINKEEQQQQLEQNKKNQEKILEATTKVEKEVIDLKGELHFSLGEEEYTIKRVYLLVPGEAGNQTNNYLLGINYDYINNTKKDIQSSQRSLLSNSSFTQKDGELTDILTAGKYELKKEESFETAENMTEKVEKTVIKPSETINETVYLSFNSGQNNILWSMIQKDKVVNYRINMADLQNMPYQSASYTMEAAGEQVGYLFDFNKLYLVYQSTANLEQWNDNKNVSVDPQPESLSPEAALQLKSLKETLGDDKLKLVELTDVTYETMNGETTVKVKDNDSVHLTFKTNDFWKQFEDQAQQVANLIPFQ